jgi:hypothetical protein
VTVLQKQDDIEQFNLALKLDAVDQIIDTGACSRRKVLKMGPASWPCAHDIFRVQELVRV